MIIQHYLVNLTILTFLGFYGRSAKYSFVEILRKSCVARILWPAAEAGELAQTAKENTVNCETAYLKCEKSAGSIFWHSKADRHVHRTHTDIGGWC